MRSTLRSPWVFRALLVAVNIAGIWWIHDDLVGAALPGLRVLAALPSRDVQAADRFTLVFDQPLSLAGEPGNAVVAGTPFTIVPHVAGHWFWAAPEKLEYRLESPLPLGRRFRMEASPALEQMLGRKLMGPGQFQFETGPLVLHSCLVTSADGEHANLELDFGQPVDPADLLRHMHVRDAKAPDPLEAQVLNQAPDLTLTVRVPRPRSDKLLLRIDAGLTGAGADLPLGEEANHVLEVEAAFTVVDVDAETPSLEAEGCIKIRFSKDLDAAWLNDNKDCIRISPAVSGMRTRASFRWLFLDGPFECGQSYNVNLSAEIRSDEGDKLGRREQLSVAVPDRSAGIAFEAGGGILSQHGNLLVDVKHVNVPVMHLQAGRVHPNNLVSHLRGEQREATSREFPTRSVQLTAPHNVPTTTLVDLRKLLGEPLGIYWLRARGPEGTWVGDSTVVAVTDLAITTKQERDGYCVWVTSLRTARPVQAAEVAAVTYNNQTLARATTDANGIARLAVPAQHPDGPAWVITARLGEDMSYIEPQERPWVLDDIEQAGRKSPATYDVMLYSERGVYRPGETIHLTGIIRDAVGNVPPPFPLSMAVQRPDGKEIAQLPISPATNAQGVFHLEYASPDVGQTGPYRFRVGLPGSKDVLGSVEALVEEFAPQRLELQAACEPRHGPDMPVPVAVASRYLFDQPAAGLPVRCNGTYRREAFISKRFADFEFTPADADAEEPIAEQEEQLDEQGRVVLMVPPPSLNSPGCWRADLHVTVTEQGGRSVSKAVSTCVDTAGRHVGLRLPAGRLVAAGVPTPIEWVQVRGDDTAAPGPATFTLTHVEQDTTLQQVDGRYVWKTVERTTQVQHADLAAPAEEIGRFDLVCPAAGLYRVTVTDCASGSTTQIDFRATAHAADALAAAGGKPDRVKLTLDRDSYTPGSTARLAIVAPFAGTMLLAIETDRVIDTSVLELNEPSAQIELPVDAGLRGGAFISAMVVRAVDPSEQKWLPHRAIGMTRLRTEHADHKMKLAVHAPQQAQPGETVPIRVQAPPPGDSARPAMVHLWAVDEGILLATAFETPDPAAHFFAPRQAEIISADVFGDLMPDHRRPVGMARIGGDGDDEEAFRKRVAPVDAPRRAPAVIWRAAMPVEPNGSVHAELPMPELTGRLRVMAVAVDGDRYGSTDGALVLASPLLVEMACPRFAAPDDVIEIPLKVFNCTADVLTVNLHLSASGPLRLDALPAPSLEVAPDRPAVVWARAVATGLGSVSLVAMAESTSPSGEVLTGRQATTFAARPAGTLHSETQVVSIQAGEPYQVLPQNKWLAGAAETTVCLGPRPTVQLQAAVEELIDYPYGCVEQTTSRLYVLLHAPELLKPEDAGPERSDTLSRMIDAGIARLWSMQTRSGGLSYWPGDSYPCTWGTAYAAEFITMAERQGHLIPPPFMTELTEYLQAQLENTWDDDVDANLRAQLCCVLARMRKPQPGWMARLSETVDELDLAGRAYLAGAWMETGRKDRAATLLTDDVLAQRVATSSRSRPTSQVHQDSVLLNVLMDLDPRHAWIPQLVQRLEKARTNGRWGSTLENAAALAALARYQLTATAPGSFEGVIRQGSWARPFDHAAVQTLTLSADQPIEIASNGQGQIYLSIATEGLLREPLEQDYDRGLTVSRSWLDRTGEPIDPARIRVGDLVLVEVTLAAPNAQGHEMIDNVAVVDALPAGFEIENPRLTGSEGFPDDEAAEADHVEFRDDRVVIFASAGRQEQVFRYALRAVTAGSFVVPPIQASCMYEGSIASVHGSGRVLIGR